MYGYIDGSSSESSGGGGRHNSGGGNEIALWLIGIGAVILCSFALSFGPGVNLLIKAC